MFAREPVNCILCFAIRPGPLAPDIDACLNFHLLAADTTPCAGCSISFVPHLLVWLVLCGWTATHTRWSLLKLAVSVTSVDVRWKMRCHLKIVLWQSRLPRGSSARDFFGRLDKVSADHAHPNIVCTCSVPEIAARRPHQAQAQTATTNHTKLRLTREQKHQSPPSLRCLVVSR